MKLPSSVNCGRSIWKKFHLTTDPQLNVVCCCCNTMPQPNADDFKIKFMFMCVSFQAVWESEWLSSRAILLTKEKLKMSS